MEMEPLQRLGKRSEVKVAVNIVRRQELLEKPE